MVIYLTVILVLLFTAKSELQLAFRKSSIVEAITNSDYFGEIANMGDSVKVIKEPEITVSLMLGVQLLHLKTLTMRSSH